ncbi:hypothetical protein H4R34_006074, partial [Dimargaris verticillata]
MGLQSFVSVAPESHFPLENLPYGVFSTTANPVLRVGVALGDMVVDLQALATANLLDDHVPALQGRARQVFGQPTLNEFMALGRPVWQATRAFLQRLLAQHEPDSVDYALMQGNPTLQAQVLVPQADCRMHLPAKIGDYTDFYASREHATN